MNHIQLGDTERMLTLVTSANLVSIFFRREASLGEQKKWLEQEHERMALESPGI